MRIVFALLVSCFLSASIGHEGNVPTHDLKTLRCQQLRYCEIRTGGEDSDDDSYPCQCCQTGQTTRGILGHTADTINGHLLSDCWTSTATDGTGIAQGDSITLTWGFVADGTNVTRGVTREGSSLIAFLDNNFSETNTSPDLTQRIWFEIFEGTFQRYAALSGLNLVYEPNDNGSTLNGIGLGTLGTVADIRIGGRSVDGQTGANALAFAYFPTSGDMVIDTDNTTFFDSNNSGFRNVIAHEFGHGLGMPHVISSSGRFLLEPLINSGFDGPQHADILALHRGYGDHFESGVGNDTVANATALGDIVLFAGVGMDGTLAQVGMTDEDFVSIDGSSDTDFYSFEVTQPIDFTITLTPVGVQYDFAKQLFEGGTDVDSRVTVDTSELNNLGFELLDQDGNTVLGIANDNGLGVADSLDVSLTPGTYFIEVTGSEDRAQLYSLNANASDALILAGYNFDAGTGEQTSGSLSATDFTIGSFSNGTSEFGFSSLTGTLFARTTTTGADSTDGDSLDEAIANDAYFSFTVTNDSGSAIDLGKLDFDYGFTRAFEEFSYQMYLMSDVGGFVPGSEIGVSEHPAGTAGDLVNNESFDVSTLGPLADTASIEFRFYLVDTDITHSRIHRIDNVVLSSASLSPPLLGDVNLDGIVNFLDISPFIAVLSSAGDQAEADVDQNGVVNFLDIAPFIAILSGV